MANLSGKKAKKAKKVTPSKIEGYVEPSETKEEMFKVEHKEFDYENAEEILDVRHLKQFFRYGRGIYKYTKAVHDVSFKVYKGEVFGLVGESGCGKTTTGRSIIKLYKITSGSIYFKGVRIAAGTRWNEKEIKFTNIRLKNGLKKLSKEHALKLKELIKVRDQYDLELFKENQFVDIRGNGLTKGEKEEILENSRVAELALQVANEEEKIDELNKAYKQDKQELIKKAKDICDEQRSKIKLANYDDKYCNKAFAKKAVENVNVAYKDFLEEYELAKAHNELNDDLKAKYEEYKKAIKEAKSSRITSKMQMIFQDPIASLNPRMNVGDIISEGLVISGMRDKAKIREKVAKMLELVGLLPEHMNRYPHEFSGGQRQRIGIARALIMNPELIIADEPVSALDVSIQAQVINLLNDLRNQFGLTILFIAHNLSVVKYFCDRIAVMYFGELVELTTSDELFKHPLHPYTKSLLSAVPTPDPNIEKGRVRIKYNPSEAHDYSVDKPTLREIVPNHFVLCNDAEEAKYLEELKK